METASYRWHQVASGQGETPKAVKSTWIFVLCLRDAGEDQPKALSYRKLKTSMVIACSNHTGDSELRSCIQACMASKTLEPDPRKNKNTYSYKAPHCFRLLSPIRHHPPIKIVTSCLSINKQTKNTTKHNPHLNKFTWGQDTSQTTYFLFKLVVIKLLLLTLKRKPQLVLLTVLLPCNGIFRWQK